MRHRQHPGRHLSAVEGRHPGRQFLGSRGVQEDPGRGLQGKVDLRVAQGQVAHGLHDVGLLRLLAFEEFAPGRGIEEEFRHLHLGAAGRGPGGGFLQGAGHHDQPKARGRPGGTGDQGEAAHRTDAGQGLAPEPQGGDVQQIRFIPELAGGVALQAECGLLRGHAPAVVHHPDAGPAPFLDLHGDGPGPGVQGVFHQLLDHRGGAQDDLPGGDLGRHLGRQNPNRPR